MALQPCRECGNEMSSEARACPKCGWRRPSLAPRVALGVVAAAAAIVLLARTATPDYVLDANARRQACEQLAGGAPELRQECARQHQRAMDAGRPRREPEPVAVPPGCRVERMSWGEQVVCN